MLSKLHFALLLVPFVEAWKGQALTRRGAFATAGAAIIGIRPWTAAATPDPIIAKGTVDNPANCLGLTCSGLAPVAPEGALYLAIRPSDQTGKVPPLANHRFAGPITFPFEFQLSVADLTSDYKGTAASALTGDLQVSARFDADGILSTSGPDDLVGRGTLKKRGSPEQGSWEPAVVKLQGRGLTGRVLSSGK